MNHSQLLVGIIQFKYALQYRKPYYNFKEKLTVTTDNHTYDVIPRTIKILLSITKCKGGVIVRLEQTEDHKKQQAV